MRSSSHSPARREIFVATSLGFAALLAASVVIKKFVDVNNLQWLLLAGSLWLFVCWQLWRRKDLNRETLGAALYPTLGWANRLTLLRGGLIALTGGFLFQAEPGGLAAWIPGLLYSIAAILDRMDGFVARRSKQTSLLGSELDTVYDALGLLVAPLLAVGYGKIHWSFLLVSAAYYIFIGGLYWRHRYNLPVYPLMPSMLRRTLAGFQMGFVAAILLPCFHAPTTIVIGVAFMLPILLGFLVDWLIVSGRIPSNAVNGKFFERVTLFSRDIFQPALRAILFASLLLLIFKQDVFTSIFLPIILLLAAAAILLGFACRINALAVLVLVTFFQGDNAVNATIAMIMFTSVALMLLGSGRFSLWQWDDRWVNRRDGEDDADEVNSNATN